MKRSALAVLAISLAVPADSTFAQAPAAPESEQTSVFLAVPFGLTLYGP